MKKAILMSLALFGAMVVSADSYLYWMVDNSGDALSNYDFAYAVLKGTTAGGVDEIEVYGQDGATGVDSQSGGRTTLATWSANISDYGSFFVELYNDSGTLLGTSSSIIDRTMLADYIKTGVTSMTASSAYAFNTFSVPEPTSGLMMLLGIGLLGLKRKKA